MTLTVGEIIKAYREHNDLSLEDFARMSGLTKAYISKLEHEVDPRNGKPINPTIDAVGGISKAMGMSAPDLLLKMGDDDKTIDTYPYKAEIELEAAKLNAAKLKRLLAYAKFLQQEDSDD